MNTQFGGGYYGPQYQYYPEAVNFLLLVVPSVGGKSADFNDPDLPVCYVTLGADRCESIDKTLKDIKIVYKSSLNVPTEKFDPDAPSIPLNIKF